MPIYGIAVVVILVVLFLANAIRILNEYERGVIFRLGRVIRAKGPGLIILIPYIDRLQRVSLRLIATDVPPQDVITRDNVSVKVSAVIYFRVVDPVKAIISVENYLYATSQLAQTTLRSVCGQGELDDLLAERDKINAHIQEILDSHTEPWGIKVTVVEVKQIDLPIEMQRAMAKQAEAERERRAKVIGAEGEFQAASRLAEAAEIMQQQPIAIQLRYLQTLREIAAENNSTTIFPVPIDLFKPFISLAETYQKSQAQAEGADRWVKRRIKEKKEKPLDKLTAKDLRELALTLEGIVGVHAMNKNELIAAIKEAKGIVDEKKAGKADSRRAQPESEDQGTEGEAIGRQGGRQQQAC